MLRLKTSVRPKTRTFLYFNWHNWTECLFRSPTHMFSSYLFPSAFQINSLEIFNKDAFRILFIAKNIFGYDPRPHFVRIVKVGSHLLGWNISLYDYKIHTWFFVATQFGVFRPRFYWIFPILLWSLVIFFRLPQWEQPKRPRTWMVCQRSLVSAAPGDHGCSLRSGCCSCWWYHMFLSFCSHFLY